MKSRIFTFAFAFLIILLPGCDWRDPSKSAIGTIERNVNAYILSNAHDPSGYEPIETVILDTIYFEENRAEKAKEIAWQRQFAEVGGAEYKEGWIKKAELDSIRLVEYADSLAGSVNPNPICAYYAIHQCRIKNKVGALNIAVFHIQVNPDFSILAISEDDGKMLVCPNLYGNGK